MNTNCLSNTLSKWFDQLIIQEAPTAVSITDLPYDVGGRIVEHSFNSGIRAYGALIQTCKTIAEVWNREFFRGEDPLRLYRMLLNASRGDDVRLSTIFQGHLGEGALTFSGAEQLSLDLRDGWKGASLASIATHFPNCMRLELVDKRALPATHVTPGSLVRWIRDQGPLEETPEEAEESVKQMADSITAMVAVLPKLEELRLVYNTARREFATRVARQMVGTHGASWHTDKLAEQRAAVTISFDAKT